MPSLAKSNMNKNMKNHNNTTTVNSTGNTTSPSSTTSSLSSVKSAFHHPQHHHQHHHHHHHQQQHEFHLISNSLIPNTEQSQQHQLANLEQQHLLLLQEQTQQHLLSSNNSNELLSSYTSYLNGTNGYFNQKLPECNKILSLCEYNPSLASLSNSSPPMLFNNQSPQTTLHYFIDTSQPTRDEITSVKEEPNPIDRLYSMQASYFCSKC